MRVILPHDRDWSRPEWYVVGANGGRPIKAPAFKIFSKMAQVPLRREPQWAADQKSFFVVGYDEQRKKNPLVRVNAKTFAVDEIVALDGVYSFESVYVDEKAGVIMVAHNGDLIEVKCPKHPCR